LTARHRPLDPADGNNLFAVDTDGDGLIDSENWPVAPVPRYSTPTATATLMRSTHFRSIRAAGSQRRMTRRTPSDRRSRSNRRQTPWPSDRDRPLVLHPRTQDP
jgi:hypothetical protein